MIKILDNRKLEILIEIVESFIETEEPVGSKTLSERSSIGVSPATIRNEMRVLEDLGLILKPHSSSGRVPSDKGYRQYVNLVIDADLDPDYEFTEIFSEFVEEDNRDLSEILELSSGLFAKKTNYTTIIIAPMQVFKKINYLRLSFLNTDKIIGIYVDEDYHSQTEIISYDGFISNREVYEYNKFISSKIIDNSIEELKNLYENLPIDFPHRELSKDLIKHGIEFLDKKRQIDVFSSGLGNLLRLSHEDDYDNVKSMIDFIEDDSNLIRMWIDSDHDEKLTVSIGRENQEQILKDASIISARYDLLNDDYGSISIIGPTHMDYKYLSETLLGLSNALTSINRLLKR